MRVFQNSYYLMRHGQSEANVVGLIVSDPAIGCHRYGLSEQGRNQVLESLQLFQTRHPAAHETFSRVLCSDFLRTRETAELMAQELELPAPQLEPGLRERYFGDWDGESDQNYEAIWEQDRLTHGANSKAVESTSQVRQRALETLLRLDNQFQEQTLLLVAHGDLLQILSTQFHRLESWQHRQLPHQETAEIRLLVKQGDPWPKKQTL